MFAASINLKLCKNLMPEFGLWDHSPNRFGDEFLGILFEKLAALHVAETTGPAGVPVDDFVFLVAGKRHFLRVDDYHEIAAIRIVRERGLMLAPQHLRNLRSQAADR